VDRGARTRSGRSAGWTRDAHADQSVSEWISVLARPRVESSIGSNAAGAVTGATDVRHPGCS
jgi:hypothetical protein